MKIQQINKNKLQLLQVRVRQIYNFLFKLKHVLMNGPNVMDYEWMIMV